MIQEIKLFLYPYKAGSKSVAALKKEESLDLKVIKLQDSKYKGTKNKMVINWGSSTVPQEVLDSGHIINHPDAVKIASCKKKFFETVEGKASIPEFTTDLDVALGWLEEGTTVVGREKLNGHSGEGIQLFDNVETLACFPPGIIKLYVKYVPKKDEYRIHVVNGEVVDMARKAKSSGAEEVNWKVRNYANGFVFVREDCNPPQQVKDEAVKAVEACGLVFGAVDVVFNNYRDKAYVLEVNTAPGLEGSTVDTYAKAFNEIADKVSYGGYTGNTSTYSPTQMYILDEVASQVDVTEDLSEPGLFNSLF